MLILELLDHLADKLETREGIEQLHPVRRADRPGQFGRNDGFYHRAV